MIKRRGIADSKKGISPVIGYILLITFVIIISVIVYQWVKTYVPREALECPDGVSLFVKEKEVDCEGTGPYEYINLTFKNNGLFNISGYFIRYSNDPDILATNSLWENIEFDIGAIEGRVSFDDDTSKKENTLGPGEEEQDNFTFSLANKISYVEIIPVRYEEIDNRLRLSSCSDARIVETICGGVTCVPTCDGNYACGTGTDGCGGSCLDGTCGVDEVCVSGSCEPDPLLCGNGAYNSGEECDWNGGAFCNDDTTASPCTCQTGHIPEGDTSINCVAAPDLIVSMFGTLDEDCTDGTCFSGNGGRMDHISVALLVTNQGQDVAENFIWEIYTDSPDSNPLVPQSQNYLSLGAGQSISPNPTLEWDYTSAGTYNPVIKIDPPTETEGSISESDETNNEYLIGTITCDDQTGKIICS